MGAGASESQFYLLEPRLPLSGLYRPSVRATVDSAMAPAVVAMVMMVDRSGVRQGFAAVHQTTSGRRPPASSASLPSPPTSTYFKIDFRSGENRCTTGAAIPCPNDWLNSLLNLTNWSVLKSHSKKWRNIAFALRVLLTSEDDGDLLTRLDEAIAESQRLRRHISILLAESCFRAILFAHRLKELAAELPALDSLRI